MIYALHKTARRGLAIGLLLAVIGGFAAVVVAPVWSHIANLQDRLEQSRMMVGRLAVAAIDDSGRQQLQRQAEAAKIGGFFIEGGSEPIRLAALQSHVAAIALQHGVKLRSLRNLPSREKNDLRLIGIQLHVSVPIDQLQKIMIQIEQHRPVLIIESMHITPLNPSRTPGGDLIGQLDAKLDVFAVEAKSKG